MEYRKLGNTDVDVSRVALGCWAFGGGDYWGGEKDDAMSLCTIDAALSAGINFFDTAESYADGESDKLLGRGMKGRRDRFVVSSKVYLDKLGEAALMKCCEESLVRLQTDYIDLFSPHFASREIPFEETFGALEKLKKQGKIRGMGISNFGVQSIAKLEEMGMLDEIELNQLPYSLLWRAIEYGILEKTMADGIGTIAYSTLAQGLLSGAYDDAAQVPDNFKVLRFFDRKRVNAGHGEAGAEQEVFRAIAGLKALCEQEGLDLASASIAWVMAQPGIQCVLTGPKTPEQLAENLKCLEVKLSPGIIEKMTAVTQPVKEKLGPNADAWASGDQGRIY